MEEDCIHHQQKVSFTEILKKHGIFTYGIHSNPNLSRYFDYDRGFDIFLDGLKLESNDVKKKELNMGDKILNIIQKKINFKNLYRNLFYRLKGFYRIKNWLRRNFSFLTGIFERFTLISYDAPYIINKIKSFLNKHSGNLFLWAHFMDIHKPYNPPEKNVLKFRNEKISTEDISLINKKVPLHPKNEKIEESLIQKFIDLYDAEINYLDGFLKELFNFIKYKYDKNCLIIITADHGESFYEHKSFGHQGSIYDELVRVPLIIKEINKNAQYNHIDTEVQLIDIPPTILSFFDIESPLTFQGQNLLPFFQTKEKYSPRIQITECYQKNGSMKRNHEEGFILISIRKEKWKYIFDEEKNQEYLFNLFEDPKELNDLSSEYKEKTEEFRLIKTLHLKRVAKSKERGKIKDAIRRVSLN
jgi:hypothetical protein